MIGDQAQIDGDLFVRAQTIADELLNIWQDLEHLQVARPESLTRLQHNRARLISLQMYLSVPGLTAPFTVPDEPSENVEPELPESVSVVRKRQILGPK